MHKYMAGIYVVQYNISGHIYYSVVKPHGPNKKGETNGTPKKKRALR